MTASGVVPQGWRRERLDVIGYVMTGSTPPTAIRSYYGREKMFASPADLGDFKYVTRTAKHLSPSGFARSRRFPAGSTLFVCIGSTIGKVGLTKEDLTGNQQINAIIPKSKIDPEYLYYAATTLSSSVRRRAGEQAVPLINKSEFSEFEILVPPLPEQRAIARILSDVDELIVGIQRMIAKKHAIKVGMMQRLLTGKSRLPGFQDQWKVIRLGDLGTALRGVGYDPESDLSTTDKEFTVRLLRANNVRDGSVVFEDLQFVHKRRVKSQQLLHRGDIVICMANGSRDLVGKSAFFDIPSKRPAYTFGAFMGVFRTRTNRADPRYVAQLLQGRMFRNWLDVILAGSSINNLRPGDIEDFETPAPDALEQIAIANVLADADGEINELCAQLEKVKAIKHGMAQELLTGRTQLPVSTGSEV